MADRSTGALNGDAGVPDQIYGIPLDPSTGFGGSPGVGFSPQNLSPLATVTVTVPGSSSVPPQPMATVDAGDGSIPSQVAEYVAGYTDPLIGGGPFGTTGIGKGRAGPQVGGAA